MALVYFTPLLNNPNEEIRAKKLCPLKVTLFMQGGHFIALFFGP